MNKIISLIIMVMFATMGTVQAGGISFQLDSPDCKSAMPMDCCGDVVSQSHQESGQTDCCGAHSIETIRTSASPDQKFSAESLSDCENSFCKLPVQPPAGIIDSPRHLSNGVLLHLQQYAPASLPSRRQEGPLRLLKRTGPPVPLYARYCVLRY